MSNLNFSIPYDGKPESLEKIFALQGLGSNTVKEVYIAGPQELSAAARIMPKISLDEFTGIVDKIHAAGIRVNMLLNSVCEGSGWYQPEVMTSRINYVRLMHEEHGVETVTIANPIYIKEVKKEIPGIEICASVLAAIDTVQRAIYFREIGADIIIPNSNINRDLDVLKEIKLQTGAELKLMVNQGCLYECPFERFHAGYVSHKSVEKNGDKGSAEMVKIFFQNCSRLANEKREYVFRSPWIRPEDLRKYGEITSGFKIVGRSNPRWEMISRAYMQESWDGNLPELMDASVRYFAAKNSVYIDNKSLDKYDFFEKVTSCGYKCGDCSYCKELAEKLIVSRTSQA
jgi:collagenase-like PrtC family protease